MFAFAGAATSLPLEEALLLGGTCFVRLVGPFFFTISGRMSYVLLLCPFEPSIVALDAALFFVYLG